jgi:hypothetical protein
MGNAPKANVANAPNRSLVFIFILLSLLVKDYHDLLLFLAKAGMDSCNPAGSVDDESERFGVEAAEPFSNLIVANHHSVCVLKFHKPGNLLIATIPR